MAAEIESSTPAESQNPTDAIAELLMAEEAQEAEAPKQASSEEVDDVDESEEQEAVAEEDDAEIAQEDDGITWAKALGVDDKQVVLDENGDLAGINVKVDGKISTVGLNDLIAGYQTTKDYTQKTQALAEERRQFEEQRNSVVGEFQQKLQDVDALSNYFEKQVLAQFETIDWNRLRHENPGEYAAYVQDYQLKQNELQQIKAAIASEKQRAMEEYQKQQHEAMRKFAEENANRLVSRIPEWANKDRAKKDFEEIGSFLGEQYGFTQEEFSTVYDARLIEVARDALMYRKGKKVVEQRKAAPVAKFQKSTGTPKKVSKLDRLTKAAKTARDKKSPDRRQLETAAITELLLHG